MTKCYPLPEGLTPRLLSRQAAAAYLGLSTITLDRVPVAAIRIGSQKRWDKKALDAWLDQQSELATIAAPDGEERWDG